jgi:hypothetical protein
LACSIPTTSTCSPKPPCGTDGIQTSSFTFYSGENHYRRHRRHWR